MPDCVQVDTIQTQSGPVDVIVPVIGTGPCTHGYILSADEVERLLWSPFALTGEQGFQIAGAILGVWTAAWAIKQAIRALNVADRSDA